MREIFITMYEAEDGRKFTNKQDCYEYESRNKEISNLKRALSRIQELCNLREGCDGCPFLNGNYCGITFQDVMEGTSDTPYNWKIEKWGK